MREKERERRKERGGKEEKEGERRVYICAWRK